ncbi:HTTM domain-containing protein [Bdellovibrio bacteriovorus]|uniref:HTTM domain-containing protein n=1 Tax=Bdellovibrio bacteriovorus TaxID=959 RepID=UPI0021D2D498|nr:HTTM domain-containing protein [Bdellovibrio bacteriovorus]UXR65333.1 HTTM domain-containing protein [Bdellovibrio bacteriovorus]
MELIQILLNYFKTLHTEVKSLQAMRWARRMVYIWVLVNYTILATQASFFYSQDAYISKTDFVTLSPFEKIFNLLSWSPMQEAYPFFLIAIMGFAILGILERAPRFTAAVVYLLMINLDNRANVIMDGGNNLMHLIAFYLILVSPSKKQSPTSITVTNLAVLMIKIQVTFVYATAGLLKVMGPLWNKGVALYYTMGVTEYGNPEMFHLLAKFPLLLAALSLGTVLFQISLPYLIWMRAWRPYIILLGTGLHLSISLVMGLFMFGLAMCVSYTFFKEDEEISLPMQVWYKLRRSVVTGGAT